MIIVLDVLEKGKYVAIDLSGKNLRILLLNLSEEGQESAATVNNYIVSNSIMKGTGEQVLLTSELNSFIWL